MSTQTKHEERKKRIILIGRSTAGKTTLCQRINNEELRYYKTQTVQVINQNMIDTPGEYLERRDSGERWSLPPQMRILS